MRTLALPHIARSITKEQLFLGSSLIVSAGNYFYNLLIGRMLGPEQFADAAVLITFLLVFSFFAMTFQLTSAKFAASKMENEDIALENLLDRIALITGLIVGTALFFMASPLAQVLQTSSALMFQVFALGMPFYFLMSSRRGMDQGSENYASLSGSYQLEMLGRLLITVLILLFIDVDAIIAVSVGIVISLLLGILPIFSKDLFYFKPIAISKTSLKKVGLFFGITLLYELSQIVINNSDLLMVKHYFTSFQSGSYASMAIIGRMVYFMAWMFVMMLLPKVVKLQKAGLSTKPLLFKYLTYISVFCVGLTVFSFSFPRWIVLSLFGEEYLSIAPLLWKYAVAVSFFAKANLFAYYFLSLDQYVPLLLTVVAGIAQVICITFFHDTLAQIVHVQILIMGILLICQLAYFLLSNRLEK